MENLYLSFSAVAPIFLFILIGVIVRKAKLLNSKELARMNAMVFRVMFPFLLFNNIYTAQPQEAFHPRLLLFALVSVAVIYLCAIAVTCLIEKDNPKRGSMVQAIYRSNMVVMGLPLVSNLFGEEKLGTTALVVTIVVPIYNILAVVTFELFRGGKPNVFKILKNIAKNPLVIGAALGLIAMLFEIRLPEFASSVVSQLAGAAAPITLIILGASFKLGSTKESMRDLIISVGARLVIIPAVFLSVAVALGFRGEDFATLIALFCTPVAVTSFTMAQQMGGDSDLAANSVVFSSVISCVTMFLWIFLFKQLGIM